MKKYEADLAISALHKAIGHIYEARNYAADGNGPNWLLKSLDRTASGLHNRVQEISWNRSDEDET